MRHRSIGWKAEDEQSLLNVLASAGNRSQEEEMDFEYCPSTVEKLFTNDEEALRVQALALQKKVKLEMADISEILGYLDGDEQNLALVKISVTSKKFAGMKLSQVAAYVGKDGTFKDYLSDPNSAQWKSQFLILETNSPSVLRWIRRNA